MQSKTIPCFGNFLQALQSNLKVFDYFWCCAVFILVWVRFTILWCCGIKQEVADEFSKKNIESLKLVGGPLNLQSRRRG